ncbi:hypothetical protein [Pseudorhizobium flavum]|uniref:Uncharacterized protein n=1 Tax=Pseudorhizobium flavum TaxID=1335061 RepID=A0A7X0DFJ5_9HYPH|nr:hypothetical protein [Pseudorhizobium flavum]MBB6181234.1 hypothetical protein [Pseudorhizobium flavum]CAD6601304.1 hypothetical protein RFYW14_00850 [Pseudorhizobium flavum]CAD6615758.1 hypothetical protein RTCK_02931 [Rhizobium sp. TCK]
MTRKSKKQRNAEQAVRQRLVREAAREKRRPTRDDIARMFFWKVISDAHCNGENGRTLISKLADKIVDGLERQGFDAQEGYDVYDQLVRKYSNGVFPFRIKRHLK